jgi:hypothetical protein
MSDLTKNTKDEYLQGVGLDVGTSFLQIARARTDGIVDFTNQRDAFYEIKPSSPQNAKIIKNQILDKLGALYLVKDGNYYIIGQHAINYAATLHKSAQRPLKRGVLSTSDRDSLGMLSVIIQGLIGEPQIKGERCCYCYPANPVDQNYDNIYHRDLIFRIVSDLGYTPIPVLEAEAIMYSELIDDDLTGISLSFGAGMTNVCVSYMGENVLSFSLAKGGDYIDISVAKATGKTDTEVQTEKESETNLIKPVGETQEIIQSYYLNLIRYVVDNLEHRLGITSNVPKFSSPIPVIVSGGTSKATGFLEVFTDMMTWKNKELNTKREFPFQIKEIKYASDPLTAVANGCLILSQLD